MRQETGIHVGSRAAALKRRGSAALGVITERKPDTAVKRRTHLIRLDMKQRTQAQRKT